MDLGARLGKRLGTFVRAGKAKHFVPSGKQFCDHGRADKSCRASNKNTHGEILRVWS
ncbi:hypothetical protein GCM10010872_41840 [Dyella flava]|nr:hypothetical protein GCM10010872_41840 [Dyella flava]